jgi:hypothetical protein
MHAVRLSLLRAQADAARLLFPLWGRSKREPAGEMVALSQELGVHQGLQGGPAVPADLRPGPRRSCPWIPMRPRQSG